jgi:hypothetical protein
VEENCLHGNKWQQMLGTQMVDTQMVLKGMYSNGITQMVYTHIVLKWYNSNGTQMVCTATERINMQMPLRERGRGRAGERYELHSYVHSWQSKLKCMHSAM